MFFKFKADQERSAAVPSRSNFESLKGPPSDQGTRYGWGQPRSAPEFSTKVSTKFTTKASTSRSGITLVEQLIEYLKKYRLTADGKATFAVVQAEDEMAAIGMVLGAGWAGARSMTATSGPGISLMSELKLTRKQLSIKAERVLRTDCGISFTPSNSISVISERKKLLFK